MAPKHEISTIVNGQQILGWQSGNIESSMINPADSFVLRIPFDLRAWNTLRRDSRITIKVDGITILDGFIDKRLHKGRAGIIEITGRDRVGRLVDESAPAINFTGLTIVEGVRRLAAGWFDVVTLSDARNRNLRRGKGRRVASGSEPVITINVRVPRRGAVHPGETRWHLIHEICSRAGLICYSSSDGKELFIGKPNYSQSPQYLFRLASPDSPNRTTVREMDTVEDDGERYSMYLCAGVGGQGDTNYGTNVTDKRGRAFDNVFNRFDGTGRDFIFPKRMFLPERAFESYADAQRVAENERARRDYKRHLVSVECDRFGQDLGTGELTLFAPDTMARCINEPLETDANFLIVDCSYSFDRDQADRTMMHVIPSGTELVL